MRERRAEYESKSGFVEEVLFEGTMAVREEAGRHCPR